MQLLLRSIWNFAPKIFYIEFMYFIWDFFADFETLYADDDKFFPFLMRLE